jgi:four helix bundle protein
MLNLSHKNLDVYKLSKELVKEIYLLTNNFPKHEVYGLTNQLRRASISVPSNIAEGMSRDSNKDITKFLIIARSSLVEIDTQIEIALLLNYMSEKDITEIEQYIIRIFQMLTNLIKHYHS